MNCDRCNGETKRKTITSKKDGKEYTIFECLEGCKNGKFAYSFFPPRPKNEGKSQPARPAANGGGAEAVKLLRSIDTSLKNILATLQSKTGVVSIQETELQPDEDIGF